MLDRNATPNDRELLTMRLALDEHEHIESFGGTASYMQLRAMLRAEDEVIVDSDAHPAMFETVFLSRARLHRSPAASVEGVEALTRQEAVDGSPGVSSVRQSFSVILLPRPLPTPVLAFAVGGVLLPVACALWVVQQGAARDAVASRLAQAERRRRRGRRAGPGAVDHDAARARRRGRCGSLPRPA